MDAVNKCLMESVGQKIVYKGVKTTIQNQVEMMKS